MSRVADAAFAGVLLAFTLPLMLIVAVAIRLDSNGPVLVNETCIGRHARCFKLLQFRATVYAPNASKPGWATADLTRVGAVLRYTQIEGLPQLLNVLLGDMPLDDMSLFA